MTSPRKILLVDDVQVVRETLAELLESGGYSVLQADGMESAMVLAGTSPIDAFLLDVEMPGKGGIQLCKTLRQSSQYRMSPVIFITGALDQDRLVEAFAAGCDDFIHKPIDPVILMARLKAYMIRLEYFEELERTRRMLNRYLSTRTREIVETSTKTGELAAPEHREVVILFTDIRGFTALAEQMNPSELFQAVSSQLEDQVNLVYEHGGYIDKFGGDGVMAVFDKSDRARQACKCALRMIEKAQNPDTAEDERIRQLGIGINIGLAVIGNIGSTHHMDYSAIGTTVNLAARLCGHAEGMSIVVSAAVRASVGEDPDIEFQNPREVVVRGLKESVGVFNLIRRAPRKPV